MARKDLKDTDCDGFLYHLGSIAIGTLSFILVFAVFFWAVRFFLGLSFNIFTPSFTILNVVADAVAFVVFFCFVTWIIELPFRELRYGRKDLRILRRRYARGEISEAQFKRMLKNLKDH